MRCYCNSHCHLRLIKGEFANAALKTSICHRLFCEDQSAPVKPLKKKPVKVAKSNQYLVLCVCYHDTDTIKRGIWL